jgi:hypothetical protein
LPPWQLSKAHFHAHQDESPDVVETFENTLAAWRLCVQSDRFKVFVGHMMRPGPRFAPLSESIYYLFSPEIIVRSGMVASLGIG